MTLEGPLAAVLRRAAYLYRQPTNGQRLSVATEWIGQASSIASGLLATLQQRRDTYGGSSSAAAAGSADSGAKEATATATASFASSNGYYKP